MWLHQATRLTAVPVFGVVLFFSLYLSAPHCRLIIAIGPVGVPGGGYTIYFNYTPGNAADESAQTVQHAWQKVEFNKLTLEELNCAEAKLKKAEKVFAGDKDVSIHVSSHLSYPCFIWHPLETGGYPGDAEGSEDRKRTSWTKVVEEISPQRTNI